VESGDQPSFFGVNRQQILVWSAVGLVILLVGGNYLRSHIVPEKEASAAVTVAESAISPETVERETVLIKVHVAGAVAEPGLYQMEQDSRVDDAIERAGGAVEGADLNRVNLAAKLVDGQQIVVPLVGEPAVSAAGTGSDGAASGPEAKININTASPGQLEQIDGVGPKTAEKIVAYREEHDGFKSVEELMEVPGIGPSKFESMKEQVCI
jgi:competence protein ComEA